MNSFFQCGILDSALNQRVCDFLFLNNFALLNYLLTSQMVDLFFVVADNHLHVYILTEQSAPYFIHKEPLPELKPFQHPFKAFFVTPPKVSPFIKTLIMYQDVYGSGGFVNTKSYKFSCAVDALLNCRLEDIKNLMTMPTETNWYPHRDLLKPEDLNNVNKLAERILEQIKQDKREILEAEEALVREEKITYRRTWRRRQAARAARRNKTKPAAPVERKGWPKRPKRKSYPNVKWWWW